MTNKRIIQPNPAFEIVKEDGMMHDQFQRWTREANNAITIIGTGSPEGVVEAEQGQEYMDDAGTAGSIKYAKRDSDISGDKSKGWILI